MINISEFIRYWIHYYLLTCPDFHSTCYKPLHSFVPVECYSWNFIFITSVKPSFLPTMSIFVCLFFKQTHECLFGPVGWRKRSDIEWGTKTTHFSRACSLQSQWFTTARWPTVSCRLTHRTSHHETLHPGSSERPYCSLSDSSSAGSHLQINAFLS